MDITVRNRCFIQNLQNQIQPWIHNVYCKQTSQQSTFVVCSLLVEGGWVQWPGSVLPEDWTQLVLSVWLLQCSAIPVSEVPVHLYTSSPVSTLLVWSLHFQSGLYSSSLVSTLLVRSLHFQSGLYTSSPVSTLLVRSLQFYSGYSCIPSSLCSCICDWSRPFCNLFTDIHQQKQADGVSNIWQGSFLANYSYCQGRWGVGHITALQKYFKN